MDIVSALWVQRGASHHKLLRDSSVSAFQSDSFSTQDEEHTDQFLQETYLFLQFGPLEVSGIEKELWAERLE